MGFFGMRFVAVGSAVGCHRAETHASCTRPACRDGTPGRQRGNSCCNVNCNACNALNNCGAQLGASECCSDQVLEDNNLCTGANAGPCVLEPFDTICASNGFAGFEGTSDDGTSICCTNGCGQCGGTGCSFVWAPLLGPDCCSGRIRNDNLAGANNLCSVTGAAPCVIDNPICPDGSSICKDPHMKGLRGQKIEWSGVDGGWYCFVKDDGLDLHVNVRLTAPLPEEFPERQLVTGLSVISGGHSLVIKVTNPYETDIVDGCPDGMPTPCLANGALSVTVDGEKNVDDSPLLHPMRGEMLPGDGIEVSAANLPVECWQFGGDKIWARQYADMMAQATRRATDQTFEDWILSFKHMAAHDWCTKDIAEKGLADVQSSQAIFQIITPEVVVRLNVGIGHQVGGGADWDGRVLPDLDVWEMDVGLVGLSLEHEGLTRILGETARPVYDEDGRIVMKGNDAFRGTPEDYRVSGALGADFALLHHK